MVAHQQVLRLDTESVCEIGVSDDIISKFENILSGYDIALLSDYGKGVLSPYLTKEIIRITKKSGKMVLIDPKGKDYYKIQRRYFANTK